MSLQNLLDIVSSNIPLLTFWMQGCFYIATLSLAFYGYRQWKKPKIYDDLIECITECESIKNIAGCAQEELGPGRINKCYENNRWLSSVKIINGKPTLLPNEMFLTLTDKIKRVTILTNKLKYRGIKVDVEDYGKNEGLYFLHTPNDDTKNSFIKSIDGYITKLKKEI